MIFRWMRRQREEQLQHEGQTVEVRFLTDGAASRPDRLVLVNLGYGPELWAHYGQKTRFLKQGRILVDGKLVLDPGAPEALAARLRLPLERRVVRF